MNQRAAISEREQIALLREENLWLRAELGLLMDAEQIAEAQQVFRLTGMEARMLLVLINSRLVTKDHAMNALAEAGYDYEANDKIVDVYICKVRAKLKRFGAGVETVWGTGYRLGEQDRQRIAEVFGQQPYQRPDL